VEFRMQENRKAFRMLIDRTLETTAWKNYKDMGG
jgi:hypothetical protein